jgi:predicted ATPase
MSGSESSSYKRNQSEEGSFRDSVKGFSATSAPSRFLPEEERGLVISKQASVPFQPIGHSSNDLSELTIDKLNFHKLQLHGRESQVKFLQECTNRLNSTDNCRQFIVISGESGTGKTALAGTVKTGSKGLHVQGKFDPKNNGITAPYLGISRVCTEILGKILDLLTNDKEKYEWIRQSIVREMDTDIYFLIELIPVLSEVVDVEETIARVKNQALSAEETSNRTTFAFLRFFRVVADAFQPLVITIDDLQWADGSSVNLLEALLVDDEIDKLLLIGLYRSEEANSEHLLHHFLKRTKDKVSLEGSFGMAEVQLHNLEVKDVQSLLEELLLVDSDDSAKRVSRLAKLCKDRTLGNPFFLMQYLKSLYSHQLLSYNFGTMQWTWNEDTIKLQTDASDNVVSLLLEKMRSLPNECIRLLQFAGLLGSTFSMSSLKVLWKQTIESGTEESFFLSLEALEEAGFLLSFDEINNVSYFWVHDKIREAARTLTTEEENVELARRAGEILLHTLDEQQQGSSIFVIVNLLNAGNGQKQSTKGRLSQTDLSRWNCIAAKKAVGISAFESAAEYARTGIELLCDKAWDEEYQLAFDLHSLGAIAEGYLGNVEIMKTYCEIVLNKKEVKDVDRLCLYNILIDNMVLYEDIENAIAMILDVLNRYNCSFPRSNLSIVSSILVNLIKVKSTMKSLASERVKVMCDPARQELMELTRSLNLCFYVQGDKLRYPLTGFRAITWAAKYGVCGASAIGFAQAGVVIISVQQDYHGARQYADYAFKILSTTQSDISRSSVMMVAYTFVYFWTQSINELLPSLLESYNLGLRFG